MDIFKTIIKQKEKYGNNIVMISYENFATEDCIKSITWNDFYKKMMLRCNELISFNKKKIGIISLNSIDYIVTFYSIMASNNIVFPINYKLTTDTIIQHIKFTNTEVVYYDQPNKQLCERISKFLDNVEFLPIDSFNNENSTSALKDFTFDYKMDDIAVLLATSGSTEKPKIVQHTYKSIFAIAEVPQNHPENNGVILCTFPFFHMASFYSIFYILMENAKLVIAAKGISPDTLIDITKTNCVTFLSAPLPTIKDIINIYKENNKENDIASLRKFTTGGQGVDEGFLKQWKQYFQNVDIQICYGSSEAGFVMYTIVQDNENKVIYKNFYNYKIKQQDNNNPGELLVKGEQLFKGYYNNEHETTKLLSKGWFNTGDIVYANKDNGIEICGRIKDLIISGGENINPHEVEKFIENKFDIKDIVAVPISDEKFGESIGVIIDCGSNNNLSKKDIFEICKQLPGFMRPKHIKFAKNFRSDIGKLNRNTLANEYFS